MIVVDILELETSDYDMFQGVTYQGKPFTGKAYEKRENSYSEYSYLNGLGHGTCFTICSNGNKKEQFELFEGEEVGDSYLWFDNGLMKEWSNERFVKNWIESGILIRDYRFVEDTKLEYYSTGELMISAIGNKVEHLTKSGKEFALYENGETSFDNTIIEKYLDQICDEDCFLLILQKYVSYLLKNNRSLGITVLRRMLDHKNIHLQYAVVNMIGLQDIVELKDNLRDKSGDKRIPPAQYDRYSGFPCCSYTTSIGDMALISLKRL